MPLSVLPRTLLPLAFGLSVSTYALAADLVLPEGFSAKVFADNVGQARHITVSPSGDVYVRLNSRKDGSGVVALRDSDGDGVADKTEYFDDTDGTGIAYHNNYLYVSSDTTVYRYALKKGELKPTAKRETVIADFPRQRSHASKPLVFDGQGNLYVTIGAPSNACQKPDRQPGVKGQDPCPELEKGGGIWQFNADKAGQTFAKDGKRYATGIRNGLAIAWNASVNDLYSVQHGRDQLNTLWPDLYNDRDNAELPAEELFRVTANSDFGWPYTYYDTRTSQRVRAPEYGGDGKTADTSGKFGDPLVAFPAHWGPNDMVFYTGTAFPADYQGAALIAFHGSWNRAPLPQAGYQVVVQPMKDGKPSGPWQTFINGFAGKDGFTSPTAAEHRPTGLAVGPDGAVYVADSVKGRIWKIIYSGQ